MTILDRYVFRQLVRYFSIIFMSIIAIYLVVDFFDEIDNFMEIDMAFWDATVYFLAKTPVPLFLPLCTLLAVLVVLGLMNKNNEAVALRSSGINVRYLLRPVVAMGVGISLIMLLLAEFVIPAARSEGSRIWREAKGRTYGIVSRTQDLWIRGDRSILHIKTFYPEIKTINGITIHYFDGDFRNIRRIDAEKAVFQDGHWIFFNLVEQVLEPGGDGVVAHYDSKSIPMDFVPTDFQDVMKTSDEMGIRELRRYIGKVEFEGYDATRYRVDLFDKLFYPLMVIVLCLVASGISLAGNGRGGLALSIAWGIGIAFCFYVTHGFSLSLGYGGLLPAVIAAAFPHLLFGILGGVLVKRLE
jgi:lipopolysaccharide export system permease protein